MTLVELYARVAAVAGVGRYFTVDVAIRVPLPGETAPFITWTAYVDGLGVFRGPNADAVLLAMPATPDVGALPAAPPASTRDERGHFPGCAAFGCDATACRGVV